MNMLWHVLHVRKGFEQIVVQHLHQQGIENYLHLQRVSRPDGNGRKTVEVPLFPGYVFCRCAGSVPRETLVIPGVISVIRGGDSIDAISQEEMNNLRRLLNSGLHYEPWNFTPGKLMTIEDGPLRGVTGVPADTENKRRFMLPVTLIDRSVAVELGSATSYR